MCDVLTAVMEAEETRSHEEEDEEEEAPGPVTSALADYLPRQFWVSRFMDLPAVAPTHVGAGLGKLIVRAYRSGQCDGFDELMVELAAIAYSFFRGIAGEELQCPYATLESLIINSTIILAGLNPSETLVVVPDATAAIPIYRAMRTVFPSGHPAPAVIVQFLLNLLRKLEISGVDLAPLSDELTSWNQVHEGD